jgi:UDP-N-acetylglucosamine 2-epimerase (non-hydrolysing)
MKIMTIFGTRPELIRLSLIMRSLDRSCKHFTVHTGQNFQESLSEVFIRELEIRQPDLDLNVRSSSFGEQIGKILLGVDEALAAEKPDKVLILGDTNSALSAIVAARRGIPIFHMEAGNRCFDNRVPEEVNRRIIDHASTVLLPYTERSKENLVAEGIERERIYVTGNPIKEVLDHFSSSIEGSEVMEALGVSKSGYCLATLHRAENVDNPDRLTMIFSGFERVAAKFEKQILVSVHPRTAEKLSSFGVRPDESRIKLLEPLGFLDFVKLEQNAFAVLTDSGTVQEECCIFGVPNVTVRDVTERPETIEAGANILSGADPDNIVNAAAVAVSQKGGWTPPHEYMAENVSQTVTKILLGYTSIRRHV